MSFTINGNGGVEFLGECDISEEDLLVTKLGKQSKYEIAKNIVSSMLADGDKKSNEIYDACLNAGVSGAYMQTVKKKMGIRSVHKIDDWYWTLNPDTADSEEDEIPDDGDDETPVNFVDDIKQHISFPYKPSAVRNPEPEIGLPFGELTLIDWRAFL